MIYIIICIAVFYLIYFIVSIYNSHEKLEKLYNKYMSIQNRNKLQGKDVAFLGKNFLGLDVKIAMRPERLSDSYSAEKKIIILSEEVCESVSIASAGIVAHELGHAVQHKNKSILFLLCRFLNKFSRVFSKFAIPCVFVGGLMSVLGWNANIGEIVFFVGVGLFIVNILDNLLEIPLEKNASEIGLRFLLDNDIISKKDCRKVKKLMNVAGKTYMKNFFTHFLIWR